MKHKDRSYLLLKYYSYSLFSRPQVKTRISDDSLPHAAINIYKLLVLQTLRTEPPTGGRQLRRMLLPYKYCACLASSQVKPCQ